MVQEKGSRQRLSSWTVMHAQSISALSSGFPLLQSNAESLDRWGGKTKHHLFPYFLSNTSAKNYRYRIVYVKTVASQRWDVFETQCMQWKYPESCHYVPYYESNILWFVLAPLAQTTTKRLNTFNHCLSRVSTAQLRSVWNNGNSVCLSVCHTIVPC